MHTLAAHSGPFSSFPYNSTPGPLEVLAKGRHWNRGKGLDNSDSNFNAAAFNGNIHLITSSFTCYLHGTGKGPRASQETGSLGSGPSSAKNEHRISPGNQERLHLKGNSRVGWARSSVTELMFRGLSPGVSDVERGKVPHIANHNFVLENPSA